MNAILNLSQNLRDSDCASVLKVCVNRYPLLDLLSS